MIKTSAYIVQANHDIYLDVDCEASYENDSRVWKRRVWLDKETNKIIKENDITFSESVNDGFHESATIPDDIVIALESCVNNAISDILNPQRK